MRKNGTLFILLFILFTSLLFKDQRENNSVIPLRGYTLGNNIVVVQRDTAHPKILSWASHAHLPFVLLFYKFDLCSACFIEPISYHGSNVKNRLRRSSRGSFVNCSINDFYNGYNKIIFLLAFRRRSH